MGRQGCTSAAGVGQIVRRGAPVAPIDTALAGRHDRPMPETATLGAEFARALAVKDFSGIVDLMHPEIDFRALTPSRNWEASGAEAVISGVLRQWFEDSDEIEALEQVESEAFADRERVGYRFSIRNPDGRFVVEQQAYLSARDGRIVWMRVLCSGFRPVTSAT
jgi:hypothetical protein